MTNPPDWKQDQAETSRLPRKGAQTMLADKLDVAAGSRSDSGAHLMALAADALRAASAPAAVREQVIRGLAEFFGESVHHVWSSDEIASCLTNMIDNPAAPEEASAYLHPDTRALVADFSIALALKLQAAEIKYGRKNDWMTQDWEGECRTEMHKHIDKGDPLDVAAYLAFMWRRGWSTDGWTNKATTSSEEASTAAGEAVAPSREVVEKALCCPKGCVREDDCFVSAPGAAVRYTRTSREHEQADAIMALYAAPPAAQTDGVREATIEECAEACERRVYGKDGLPSDNEYGHYAPYNAEALACAKDVRRLALTRPNGNTP